MGETVPVGYRFHPTDEELVGHYLKYKLLGDDSRVKNTIAEVDVCKFEPWDLPAFSKVKSDDPEWFFFSRPDLKYANSKRSNRKTRAGYWKITGKERKIKTRGTNNDIGTKKTLVFYMVRGVRTNWVIHEYHAVTFPEDKRTFVLCRLMQKAEKKAEGRTDELVNEGEPFADDHENQQTADGEPFAADHENQQTADRTPYVFTLPDENLDRFDLGPFLADEYDFPSLQPSPIVIGQEVQEPHFQDTISANDFLENENNIVPFPFDTTEGEGNIDLFLDSILVDEDDYISEERKHAFVHDSTPSQPLTKVYYESSETDTEQASARYGYILDSTIGDDIWGVDTSSDSTANKPLSISVIESVSSPSPAMASFSSTSRRAKTKYHPRSDNFVSQRAAPRRLQTQRKVSSKEVSQPEVRKETRILESNRDQKKAQDARSRKNLETTYNQSSSINAKDSFIYLETPSICQNPNPRSVYLVNVGIGILLLIVTIWDMVSFGK